MEPTPASITFYLPYNHSPRGRWRVLEGTHAMGTFATRSEAVTFALRLAGKIVGQRAIEVRVMVEEAQGSWTCLGPDALLREARAS
ncbi:hypothetical protein [Dyella sp.]|jgi:hypothetical protein|uniref:hypothetical protein n=1 Tax=Dyella sp. TaxID=1869338 RepID=UPI002D767387|nr:hypothetical protein [Dyella sp.]HET6433105.1 hypothetical protein [Dyella sp.]